MYSPLFLRPLTKAVFFALILLLTPFLASAATAVSGAKDGVAIGGYDTVAYFTLGKQTHGSAQFSYRWHGADWLFASADHRDTFAAAPEQYAPQYGGYCAYAMSGGSFADGDGERWEIVDNKLYLNNNWLAQKLWDQDIPGYLRDSDNQWPKVKHKLETVKQ